MKKCILVFLLIFSLVSCEDFLSIKPKSQVIPTTTKDYEMLLNMYNGVETVGIYSCFLTDDVFFPEVDASLDLSVHSLYPTIFKFYSFDEELYTSGENDRDWNECYSSIFTYNVIIDEVLDSTESTEEEKNKIYAEALLSRAFQYHQLITLYAKAYNIETADKSPGVPLILAPDINQTNISRASIQQVYDRLEADLIEAIPLLPEIPTLNAYRGSKAAAETLLARFYLYQGRYKEALDLVESALKTKSDLLNLNNYEIVNPTMADGRTNVPIRENNPEALYVKITIFIKTMSGQAYVDYDLLDLFDKNNDRRFKLFITNKFVNIDLDHYLWAPAMDANIGISTPEVYLISAECNARLGNINAAMSRLEELRKNRYENYAEISKEGLTKNDVIKLVLDERRRELMMIPCVRLADIKRLGFDPNFSRSVKRTINGVTTIVAPTSNRLILQIPHIVMQFNPKMEQNNRTD